MIRLVLSSIPPSLNQYLRMHWAVKRKLRVKYHWELLSCLSVMSWEQKPKQKTPKASVKISVFRPRRLDQDNLTGGLKPLIDAMRDVGLIRDDSPRWLDLIVRQEKDSITPRVEIEVEELQSVKIYPCQEGLQ